MVDTLLYWLPWKWIPIRWRVALENAWYWIVDAPLLEPPDYVTTITMRTRRQVKCPECGQMRCGLPPDVLAPPTDRRDGQTARRTDEEG